MHIPSPLAVIPASRLDRWGLLREVLSQWYPPLTPPDGVSATELDAAEKRLGISLPQALREWYLLAGRRADIWSRQDHFLSPGEYRIEGDHLVFLAENQHVVEWGIRVDDLESDDPPVFTSSITDPPIWLKENNSVSEFALQFFTYCLKWSVKNRWWANAYVTLEVVDCVNAHLPRLPFPQWHWPAPTQYYGSRDIIVETQADINDDHVWLYVVARTSAATESFKNAIGTLAIEWQSSSEDWPQGWMSAAQDSDA